MATLVSTALLRGGTSSTLIVSSSSSSASLDDDGMVFLPRASPFVTALCVTLYVALALVALARMLTVNSSASRRETIRRADAIKRQRTFQRLLLLFALTRAASFLPSGGLSRGLLNRLSLCIFFSLVLFQVLFWIDIANAKVSTRSRRIWNAFIVANTLFYAAVLGLCVLRWREVESTRPPPEQLDRARLWDLVPVLLIALGSLAASLGLLYSTCKTRRRVGRVLRQFAEHSLPKRLNDRVESKLQRALHVTNVIMGICSVLFLLRTILYLQRPFSQTQCGAIRDPNACVLIGYALPELVPCSLFLVLMWEVEPHLELPARRKSSVNKAVVARAAETTPLLRNDRHNNSGYTVNDDKTGLPPVGLRTPVRIQRPSSLSSALGGNVIASARRQLRRVLEESFGMRSDEEVSTTIARRHPRVESLRSESSVSRSSSGHDHRDSMGQSPLAIDARSRENSGIARGEQESGGVFVWMSFQCFHLKLPSPTDSAVVLVLHEMDVASNEPTNEFGRTEIAYSTDPFFHVMLPVQVNESRTLRASVYAITRPKALQDLNSQWLIGSSLLPLAAYLSSSSQEVTVVPGAASVHELKSPLSRTNASGELVVRCEAPLLHGASVVNTDRLERIARAFVYQPTTATAEAHGLSAGAVLSPKSAALAPRLKLLVEEELIESVYTWEMPYQLLQLILSDLLIQLDVLKQALLEPNAHEKEEVMTLDPPSRAVPSGAVPTRTIAAPSVGMLSEMIMQIQGDAMERKSKKWGEELVAKMEKYIDDVEAAILRYESSNHGGLTFKPSTMKADSGLSFLALNLHQQLVSVGHAVTASTRDLQDSDTHARVDAERYVHLVDSTIAVDSTASHSSIRMMEVENGDSALFQESDDDESVDEDQVSSPSTKTPSHLPRHHDLARTHQPEPVEALRRRVISFDSAETIVNLQMFGGPAAVPLSREQRQLAESIVALGIDNALDMDGVDEAEKEPDSVSPLASFSRERLVATRHHEHDPHFALDSRARVSLDSIHKTKLTRFVLPSTSLPQPFADEEMYGTTTVGAFAAHVYGFRKGGVRQLRAELQKLTERMARESERAASELTVEALEREYVELKWHIDRRLEVAFSQAMSALATCFQQTLFVHLHTRACRSQVACGFAYLEQLVAVGFVFSVESLLSTYSKEAGMLGDMEAAVRELERVHIKLRPVHTPRAAQFRVSVTSGPRGLTMELPLIVAPPEQFPARTMHRVLGQDASTGAVYLSLASSDEYARAKRLLRQPIAIIPLIFSQGMNELQTVANTVGKDALQREINRESLATLEHAVDACVAWWRQHLPLSESDAVVQTVRCWTLELRDHVARADRGKHMDILTLSSAVARAVGGGRVTCCKSAKDRTSMAVTLEEALLLVQHHGLRPTDRDHLTALLRTHGVRRENARKNIGQAQYCFSALQNYLLPTEYQCPPGTGGGASTLS